MGGGREEKRQKELIFHVLLEQPFENSGVFKANNVPALEMMLNSRWD